MYSLNLIADDLNDEKGVINPFTVCQFLMIIYFPEVFLELICLLNLIP